MREPPLWRDHVTNGELRFTRYESATGTHFVFMHKSWLIKVSHEQTLGSWKLRGLPPAQTKAPRKKGRS